MKAWVQAPRACMLTLMAVMLMVAPLAESLATKMQSAGVLNLLRKAQPQDVVMHPYPYIVIKDAWPKPLYDRLSREFPSIKAITSGPGIPGAGVGSHRQSGAEKRRIRDCASHACVSTHCAPDFLTCACSSRPARSERAALPVEQTSLTGVGVVWSGVGRGKCMRTRGWTFLRYAP